MTVAELIAKLQEMPQDMEVSLYPIYGPPGLCNSVRVSEDMVSVEDAIGWEDVRMTTVRLSDQEGLS